MVQTVKDVLISDFSCLCVCIMWILRKSQTEIKSVKTSK